MEYIKEIASLALMPALIYAAYRFALIALKIFDKKQKNTDIQ